MSAALDDYDRMLDDWDSVLPREPGRFDRAHWDTLFERWTGKGEEYGPRYAEGFNEFLKRQRASYITIFDGPVRIEIRQRLEAARGFAEGRRVAHDMLDNLQDLTPEEVDKLERRANAYSR